VIRALRHLRHRPAMSSALVAFIVTSVPAAVFVRPTTAVLIAWDAGVVVFIAVILTFMFRATVGTMKRRAALLNENKWTFLVATVLATLAAMVAIVAELVAAKGTPTAPSSAALAGITVLASWCFIHCFFAQHYAHEYWLEGQGLIFPGNESPTYSEFLYFSFTVGMTAQLSDVTTNSPIMRRVVLMHGLLSFLFNTAILASAINLAAGLAG
jgi:uncharacterized membrane protein